MTSRADSVAMDIPSPAVGPAAFDEWLELGVEKGWVSQPFCGTHDVAPMTPEEEAEFEEGYDPCSALVRLWPEGKPAVVNYGREDWS